VELVIGGGESCVVAAHSMGGTVATAAAEIAPELFAHLVYVTAFAPVSGQTRPHRPLRRHNHLD
jgi:pimeloyl-ACP methyl ester carboxylesterase